ncbi:MAG: DinB family protein [Gemmatimonadaceae bacterium]
MRSVDALVQEFDQEAPITRRVLERVPLDKKDWKPHQRSTSLGNLAAWMANAPGWTAGVMHTDGIDVSNWESFPVPASTSALLSAFDQGCNAARAALAKLDDAAAAAAWNFRMGGKTLNTMPRAAFARLFLLSDTIHHRGQMSVYLRLLEVPVPAIYGPSADDNPYF